ncbi:hypothetical protein ACFXTH_038306 [Malus domestica]
MWAKGLRPNWARVKKVRDTPAMLGVRTLLGRRRRRFRQLSSGVYGTTMHKGSTGNSYLGCKPRFRSRGGPRAIKIRGIR